MKRIVALISLILLIFPPVVIAQSRPPTSTSTVLYGLPHSAYGYWDTVLPGATRAIPVNLWYSNLAATGYTTSPTGTVINAVNNASVGDTVIVLGFVTTPMAYTTGQSFTVTSRTPTQIGINFVDGGTTTNSESQATVRVLNHPGWTGKVKWEIVSTGSNSSETFKLQDIAGTIDTGFVAHPVIASTIANVRFTVGPVEGTPFNTGNITAGNFAMHGDITFDLKATSVDDPTQTYSYHYRVGKNGGGFPGIQGKAYPDPGYEALYKNRYVPMINQVFGNVNQMTDWTITSAPPGGDATIIGATYPQPVFYSGTVTGLYGITVCPAVDHSILACAHISKWVSADSPPAGNARQVEMVPCDTGAGPTVMGITWTTIYDVKPGGPYPDMLAIPQNPPGPVLVRLWNTGANGSPTEYHNQVQINTPTGGPFTDTHPALMICGVKNATTGEMPIIDADNSHANSWASPYIVGPYSTFGIVGDATGPFSFNGSLQPFSYVTVANIEVRNATIGYHFYSVADGSYTTWGEASGVRPTNSIQYFNWIGIREDNVSDGLFDDCNAQNGGWPKCTANTYARGNHLSNYGYPDDYLAHPVYRQAERLSSFLNRYDGAISGSQGTFQYSDRGTRSFHMYERAYTTNVANQASVGGGHSESQDNYNILNNDDYWGFQGASSCNTPYSTAMGCVGLGGGIDPIGFLAAIQEEHSKADHYVGNAFSVPYVYKTFGVEGTHSFWSYQPYSIGGWNLAWTPENLVQYQNFSYNTIEYNNASTVVNGQLLLMEDSRYNFQDAYESLQYLLNPPYYGEIYFNNNIFITAAQPGCVYNCNTLDVNAHQISHFKTNIFAAGYIDTTLPLQSSVSSVPNNGYQLYPRFDDWGDLGNMKEYLEGWTAPNFLHYTTYPIQQPSMVPLNSSQAVGVASALTGEAAYYPPRLNALDAAGTFIYTLRTDTTTLGAYDPNGGPTLSFIVVSPNTASITVGNTLQLSAFCHYSDGSIVDCTSTVAWAGGSTYFHMDPVTKGLVVADSPGSANSTATVGAISGSSTITVVAAPPRYQIEGLFNILGSGKIIGH